MLLLSRGRGESIIVNGVDGGCLLTVLEIRGGEVSLSVRHTPGEAAGTSQSSTVTLIRDASVKVGAVTEVTLVDVREDKARLGIVAPREAMIHRLEIWEAIRRENRRAREGGPDDGFAGAAVPRPQGPKPPLLDVHSEEPPMEGE